MLRLRDDQWDRIREHFPEEHIPEGRPGRKPVPARAVLEAVLWILNTGAQWHMLPQCYPNYKTVHRRFQWCEREVLREIFTQLANTLREEGAIDEHESFIDATFASAKGGGDGIGPHPPGQRCEDPRDCGSPWAAALSEPIIMRSRWCNSVSNSTCWRPSRSTSLAIAPAGWGEYDRATSVYSETQDPRRPVPPPLSTPLARRAFLCLAAMEAALAHPLGVLRGQFPGLCPTRLHHDAAQAILR